MKLTLHSLKCTILFFLGLFGTYQLEAQPLEVIDGATNPYTPENLISNVFLGEGVEVIDVQFFGVNTAVGYFKNGLDEIGIDRGIVMSSGRVTNSGTTLGIVNPGSSFASSNNGSTVTDPDLAAIGTGSINNGCKYLITFIPTSDTLRFKFVFGSEEYPEYACTSFNDVFGFFITGPGINGPFQNNGENIALIPGTSQNVSINNLHPQNGGNCPPVNAQYYNNNNGMSTLPVYDGFTDVFTAEAVVIPCQEYTIKLVLADVGDAIFDTGVFLEAKSFGTGSLDVDIATVSLDGTITEDCSDAVLTFTLPTPTESDFPIDFNIFGSAVNGVDYTEIPVDLIIPAGDSTISIPIHAFNDGIVEGLEFIGIDVQRDVCNRDTFYISIRENELIPPELGPDQIICLLDTIQLDGMINLPLPPPPSFSNVNDQIIGPPFANVYSPVQVAGVQPFQLGPGVIQSVCINIDHNWLSDLDIYLLAPNGQFMELTTDNGSNGDDYSGTCFTPDASLPITYIAPPASGAPYTGTFAAEGVWSDLWSGPENPTNGEWNLLMIDDANGFQGTLLDWTITFNPLYQIYYEWIPSTGLSCPDCPQPLAFPDTTTTYVLRVYDSYGCETFDTMTVFVEDILPAPVVECGTITDSCITFTWVPIPGAFDYEITTNGVNWELPNGLFAHTVCGLSFNSTVTIQVRALDNCDGLIGTATCTTPDCDTPSPFVSALGDASCFGSSDGSFSLSATGPYPPYYYTLGGVTDTIGSFPGLSAGNYTVTVMNSVSCPTTITVSVAEPPEIALNEMIVTPISCNGANDGVLTVAIAGGTYPYSFDWGGGVTDSIAVGLSPGLIQVTVTDGNGCQSVGIFDVVEPDPLALSPSNNFINCSGDNTGEAFVEVVGGTEPYSYQWDPTATNLDTSLVNGLFAGTYFLTVTDVNGCQDAVSFLIDESSPILLATDSTDANCNSSGDGTASVIASGGGVGIFTYEWDANANNQGTATATGLDVGTYWVTVSDILGCKDSVSVSVVAPNAMNVAIQTDSTSCYNLADGFGELTVSGGTPGYTYAWSDGGPATQIRNNLAPGAQSVTITDANDCFEVIDFELFQPAAIMLDLTSTLVNCFGGADGTATVVPAGGTGTFQYLWTNNQATQTATGLAQGTAGVTVTDANGCEASSTVEVDEPALLVITSLTSTPALCFGGSSGTATVTATGGTGAYTYKWSNNQQGPTASSLPAGPYTVTVTDANGCTAVQSTSVTQPTQLTSTMGGTNLTCSGSPDGSATVTPSGGTPPYSYVWSNGQITQTANNLPVGTATVTITDGNGCQMTNNIVLTAPVDLTIGLQGANVSCNGGQNGSITVTVLTGTGPYEYLWSNNATTATISGLSVGAYIVTVTDASGCEETGSVQITQPQVLKANLSQSDALCYNASTGAASVAGIFYGANPANPANFTFAWNTVPVQTTATATGLMGGQTYSVIITDQAGCTVEESITIGNPPPIDIFVVSIQDAACFGGKDGTAMAGAAGGSPPYTFQWAPGTGGQLGEEATGLVAGTYGVTVTDSQGCTNTTLAVVGQPSQLKLSFSIDPVDCYGYSTGALTALPSGGTAPYVVSWSTGQGGYFLDALATGAYQATLTDANGCDLESEAIVPQPESPIVSKFTPQDVSCYGGADGTVIFDTYGGTPLYSYSLDGLHYYGAPQLFGLLPGSYNVFIRDANGCGYISDDVVIGEPDPLVVDLGPDVTIDAGQTVDLSAIVQNATGALSYSWESISRDSLTCYDCPETSSLFPVYYSASFRLTVTDENGCEGTDIIRILVDKADPVMVPTGFSPNGDGSNDKLLVHGKPGTRVWVFQIFDRWGELVYDNGNFLVNDPNSGWDGSFKGQLMNSGAFLWYMEVIFEDGTRASYKGTTTLIR
ncbi:MAG: choice-of-anchor L domain-containing protein [Saprospirales bacterium]|nr:choice-of-anchor L domain-containing protein [Saprospirales bacterium]MBK8490984.1 choice-of-anchor L domain-containing protein [Saprospirales bacterium]